MWHNHDLRHANGLTRCVTCGYAPSDEELDALDAGGLDDGTRAALVLTAEMAGLGVLTQAEREKIDDRLIGVAKIRDDLGQDSVTAPRTLLIDAASLLQSYLNRMHEDDKARAFVNDIREALEIIVRKEN